MEIGGIRVVIRRIQKQLSFYFFFLEETYFVVVVFLKYIQLIVNVNIALCVLYRNVLQDFLWKCIVNVDIRNVESSY